MDLTGIYQVDTTCGQEAAVSYELRIRRGDQEVTVHRNRICPVGSRVKYNGTRGWLVISLEYQERHRSTLDQIAAVSGFFTR